VQEAAAEKKHVREHHGQRPRERHRGRSTEEASEETQGSHREVPTQLLPTNITLTKAIPSEAGEASEEVPEVSLR